MKCRSIVLILEAGFCLFVCFLNDLVYNKDKLLMNSQASGMYFHKDEMKVNFLNDLEY